MNFIKIPLFLASITCLFLLSCESNVKPPLNFATGDFDQFSDKLESLIEYEKKNRNQFDTILLDFVLGSSKKEYDNAITLNKQKGLLMKDSSTSNYNLISFTTYFHRMTIDGLPKMSFYDTFFKNKLQSVSLNPNNLDERSMSEDEYNFIIESLKKKYGENNLIYENNRESIIIWVKGDLKIELKEIFTNHDGYHNVALDYSKISINEQEEKYIIEGTKKWKKERNKIWQSHKRKKEKKIENASKHL